MINNNNNENKNTRGEWLILLLSIVLLLLLLLIFAKIGISYYKLQKNSVFKIYDNVVVLGPGEFSDDFAEIMDEIESLPSIEDIRNITDLDTLYDLIDRIYSIFNRVRDLPDEERYYFNSVYREPLEELLDALWDRVEELGGKRDRDRESEDEYPGGRRVGPGGEEAPQPEEEERPGGGGGGGGSHPSGPTGKASAFIVRYTDETVPPNKTMYEYRRDEEGNITYWKVQVDTDGTKTETEMEIQEGESIPGGFYFELFEGTIYPGDTKSKKYEADITYTGRVGLNIQIPQGNITEDKNSIASKLECEVYVPDKEHAEWSSGVVQFKGMNVTYPLPQAGSGEPVTVPVEIVVSVPKNFNDDYTWSGDNRYQGKSITNFTVKWSVNDTVR